MRAVAQLSGGRLDDGLPIALSVTGRSMRIAATAWTVLEGAAEFPRKRWMEMFSEMCLTISGCAWEEAYYVGHQQVRRTSVACRLLYYVLCQHHHSSPACPSHPCPRKVSRPRSTRLTTSLLGTQKLSGFPMPSMKSSRFVDTL